MNWHKVALWLLAASYFFMLIGAIGTHTWLHRAPLEGFGSASFLLVAGALLLLATPQEDRRRMLMIGLIGYLMEVIGVNYGGLFGRYRYTEVLAPNLLGAPVVMICAWFILISYVKQLLLPLSLSAWAEVILGGAWMTAIDLLLDPVAAHPFNFWNWTDDGAYYGIPGQNFLGWFGVSVLILGTDKIIVRKQWQENPWARVIGLSMVILYTVCAVGYGYFVAGMVGVLLLGMQGWASVLAKGRD